MIMPMRLIITLYYIGLPLAPVPVLWKANIYNGATVYIVCRMFLYLLLGMCAVLCCSFILVRLLLFVTALSIREEFYFVVLPL